jgi:hypothetical protein
MSSSVSFSLLHEGAHELPLNIVLLLLRVDPTGDTSDPFAMGIESLGTIADSFIDEFEAFARFQRDIEILDPRSSRNARRIWVNHIVGVCFYTFEFGLGFFVQVAYELI